METEAKNNSNMECPVDEIADKIAEVEISNKEEIIEESVEGEKVPFDEEKTIHVEEIEIEFFIKGALSEVPTAIEKIDEEETKRIVPDEISESVVHEISKTGNNKVVTAEKPVAKIVKNNIKDDKPKIERTDRLVNKRHGLPTKIVVRRLPPTMTKEEFINQVSPIPDYDYIKFTEPDVSYFPHCFSRIYINFVNPHDLYQFKDKFDNYVFVDGKGNEYPAVVEFAFFQRIPKKRTTRKKDPKCGTIESDPHYLSFLESLNEEPVPEDKQEFNYQIDQQGGENKKDVSTPLVEFVNQRRQEKFRIREERKEERKRRELDRKKMKDEEKRRRRMATKEFHHREHKDGYRNSQSIKEQNDATAKESSASKELQQDANDDDKDSVDKESDHQENGPSKSETNASHPVLSREFKKSSVSKRPSDSYGQNKKMVDKNDRSRKDREKLYEKSGYGARDSQKHYQKPADSFGKPKYLSNKSNSRTVNSTRIVKSTKIYSKYESTKPYSTNSKPSSDNAASSKSKDFHSSKDRYNKSYETKNVQDEKKTSCEEKDEKCSQKSNEKTQSAYQEDKNEVENSGGKNTDEKDDPRKQRRIRNKDRPALEIYRPGMRRLCKDKKVDKTEEEQKKLPDGE